MPPLRPLLLALVACLSALLGTAAAADGYTRDATRILNQGRAAQGGAGWNQLRGWRESGLLDGARYETWLDPLRYGARDEIAEPAGKRIHGFNGVADWQISPSGEVVAANDRASLSRAKTRAFIDGWLFYFPSRFDGRGAYLGVRTAAGRAFNVVRVQPAGGAPRELWFDARTHLLGRIVERNGAKVAALRVLDYRKVGPVLLPHRFEPEPGAGLPRRQVEAIAFSATDRELFSLPKPPPPPPPPPVVVEPPKPPPPPPEPPKKKRRPWPFR